jgi:GDP-4-dehydro-6-deoxy-D-mannose reductase
MRILVTGITGFVGGHLAEALLAQGRVELFGISRRGEWPAEWQHLAGRVKLRACDLGSLTAIEALLREVQAERIFHLAGYAHVGRSNQEWAAAWAGNLTATLNLYQAICQWGRRPRILYAGSGHVYGYPETPDQVYHEHSLMRPVSPYAASKAAADLASYQYAQVPGLPIVRARPLNHIGPRQSAQYAVASFASQVVAIERGLRPPVVETGKLSPCRDLTDVRDVVQAYLLLMEHGQCGEVYNIASGAAYSMQAVLDRLLALAQVRVEVKPLLEQMRAGEVAALRADSGKLRRETGWAPRFAIDQTLKDTLDYWRSTIPSSLVLGSWFLASPLGLRR